MEPWMQEMVSATADVADLSKLGVNNFGTLDTVVAMTTLVVLKQAGFKESPNSTEFQRVIQSKEEGKGLAYDFEAYQTRLRFFNRHLGA